MKELLLLIGAYCLCCCYATAQEAPDTVRAVRAESVDSAAVRFSCQLQGRGQILLEWTADSVTEGDYFIIEHSADDQQFQTLGAIRGINGQNRYQISDNAPFGGSNYYRLKRMGLRGQVLYSKILRQSSSAAASFRFYPNPVDKMLIIQSDHAIDIQVLSPMGALRLSRAIQPGLQVINLSALEKGTYLLRISDKENKTDRMEQLIKN